MTSSTTKILVIALGASLVTALATYFLTIRTLGGGAVLTGSSAISGDQEPLYLSLIHI